MLCMVNGLTFFCPDSVFPAIGNSSLMYHTWIKNAFFVAQEWPTVFIHYFTHNFSCPVYQTTHVPMGSWYYCFGRIIFLKNISKKIKRKIYMSTNTFCQMSSGPRISCLLNPSFAPFHSPAPGQNIFAQWDFSVAMVSSYSKKLRKFEKYIQSFYM